MSNENLEELFKKLQDKFDFEEPINGHRERFLEKLNQSNGVVPIKRNKFTWWRPLSIAASIVLICMIGIQLFNTEQSVRRQVVEISPEVSRTESYFASLIEVQVQLLKNEKSPATAKLVDDTLSQLKKLESDYKALEKELLNGGNSKLILNAMITNFQTRIDLLQEVLTSVENIKNLKSYNDENITI
ncbi:hypothetical protein HME9304_02687 [Flagellimonas maritima]|uniref:Anti-sigma factor n=1 Tax=Flagellimonas maritima TaxID=1383885 RepID=A0A2Z4LVC9_9FLAO|nr:hypothetical protein [Allomuricauda aurantiaca]AWX45660.1 hypothetical protein HME9304_02687 [Allomuricauda aurantiaca]